MNAPMRMSEDCISLALDQRGRVLLRPKSEQCRKHRVVSQPVDVDVPRKSADDREHGRADDVADIGGVSLKPKQSPGFIASNVDSRHPTVEFRLK